MIPYDGRVANRAAILSKRITIPVLWLLALALAGCAAKTPDLAELSQRSQKILALQSCEYVYRDVVYLGHLEKLLGLLTTKETRVLFSVNLKIKAGLDLGGGYRAQAVPAPFGSPGPAVKLLLPPAAIREVDADESSIRQYFAMSYGLLQESKVSWLDVQAELAKAGERAKADAIKRGLLKRAWDNASTLLANLYRQAGFRTVIVEEAAPAPAPEKR